MFRRSWLCRSKKCGKVLVSIFTQVQLDTWMLTSVADIVFYSHVHMLAMVRQGRSCLFDLKEKYAIAAQCPERCCTWRCLPCWHKLRLWWLEMEYCMSAFWKCLGLQPNFQAPPETLKYSHDVDSFPMFDPGTIFCPFFLEIQLWNDDTNTFLWTCLDISQSYGSYRTKNINQTEG